MFGVSGGHRRATSLCVLVALALATGACADDDGGEVSTSTGTNALTVYSSLPVRGDAPGVEMSNAIKLALLESGGKVGPFTVKYVSLDDGSRPDGVDDKDQIVENARRAVQDRSTIAYIGEYSTGASALSIPLLNEARILQISPHDTRIGLTQADGASKGEPDKYYPSGIRTFGRVVPADDVQVEALVGYQTAAACASVHVVDDGTPDGRAIASAVEDAVTADGGPEMVGTDSVGDGVEDATEAAEKITAAGADCVFYGAASGEQSAERARVVWRAIHAADRDIKLFGPRTLATSDFVKGLGSVARNVYLTAPELEPETYPAVARDFFESYEEAYGRPAGPKAIYSYEAMKTALVAIQDAGAQGNERAAVVDAFLAIEDRDSVLGTYSIDRFGDTTLSTYGGYRVVDGELVFDQAIDTAS